MKHIRTCIVICAASLLTLTTGSNGYAQSKKPKPAAKPAPKQVINKIGDWVIGRTTTKNIHQLADSLGIQVKATRTIQKEERYKYGQTSTKNITQIIGGQHIFSSDIDGFGMFAIDYINISGVEIGDVLLRFYNDTLYSIIIDALPENVSDAMDAKYGEGRITDRTTTVTCRNAYQTFPMKEGIIRKEWGNQPGLRVYFSISRHVSSKCEETITALFSMSDERVDGIVSRLSNEKKDKIKERESEAKRKSLEGF